MAEEFDLQAELSRALNEDAQSVESAEVAEPQTEEAGNQATRNTTERDSFYADQRRKQELEAARAENRALQAQLQRAQQAFGNYWDGNSLDELTDRALAQAQGVDVDTIRRQRTELYNQAAMEAELEEYRQREIDRQMDADLKAIQSVDPTVTSLNDLSETFLRMRFNSVQPMDAKSRFLRAKQIEARQKTPKPASTGSMTSTGVVEREFFTSQELDRLTSKDLDDPKVMEKAMRSLARLK